MHNITPTPLRWNYALQNRHRIFGVRIERSNDAEPPNHATHSNVVNMSPAHHILMLSCGYGVKSPLTVNDEHVYYDIESAAHYGVCFFTVCTPNELCLCHTSVPKEWRQRKKTRNYTNNTVWPCFVHRVAGTLLRLRCVCPQIGGRGGGFLIRINGASWRYLMTRPYHTAHTHTETPSTPMVPDGAGGRWTTAAVAGDTRCWSRTVALIFYVFCARTGCGYITGMHREQNDRSDYSTMCTTTPRNDMRDIRALLLIQTDKCAARLLDSTVA